MTSARFISPTATGMSPERLAARIEELRAKLGSRLVVEGHHYQDESVIRHTDLRGDSLELARKVMDITAEHIVFCGVFFMAESAALLARPGQTVHLPELSADCVMARMAPYALVEKVIRKLSEKRRIIPLAYVNSSVAVKAVVGKYGGGVCTSANAKKMLNWAFEQGDAVLFLPDKNLAWNTADLLGLPLAERHMLQIRKDGEEMDLAAASRAKLLSWPGCCAIHARFNLRQIRSRRAEYPGLRVVAHPECAPEVVAASDAVGSTSFIIKYVDEAPDGATIAVGTEINLVERLAEAHKGRLTVIPLLESECSHMDRTTPVQLRAVLEAVADPENPEWSANAVSVPHTLIPDAQKALARMLAVSA